MELICEASSFKYRYVRRAFITTHKLIKAALQWLLFCVNLTRFNLVYKCIYFRIFSFYNHKSYRL